MGTASIGAPLVWTYIIANFRMAGTLRGVLLTFVNVILLGSNELQIT